MLWREEVIGNDIFIDLLLSLIWEDQFLSKFDNEMYQRDDCVKSYIWNDVILLFRITLLYDQGRKSESLEERRNIM